MNAPSIPVGFNYSLAILQILKVKTYEQVATYLGYESVGSISGLIDGRIPSHPVGEAIFVLYRELFGDKPPMTGSQATGVQDYSEGELNDDAKVAAPCSIRNE